VVGVVLFAFNYQNQEQLSSVKETFPGRGAEEMADFEYEFVDESAKESSSAVEGQETPAQVVQGQQPQPTPSGAMTQNIPQARSTVPAATPQNIAGVGVPGGHPFTIQVSSFKDRQQAERALQDIKKVGHPAYITSKDLKDKGVWHRIYVGSFSSKKDADEYLTSLRKDYKNSFIVSLHN
jgi:cell division septation protein DedD